MLVSALATFSILWLRDAVRIVEPAAQASVVSADVAHVDPRIEHLLGVRDSFAPDAIESDIREIELASLGEELSEIEALLGTQ